MATTSPARARKTAAAKDTSPPATKKATPRRAAAKRAPAEKAPAKKTTTRTTAAQDPGKATKKATTTAARTKAAAAVKKTSVWPEFITHKMITAHYQACLHGLPTRNIRDWRELPTGIAAIHFPSGARLDHTPADDAPFHANTPCPQGVTHRHPVRTIADLKDAEGIAKACTDWHGEAKPQHLSARLQVAKKSVAKTQSMSKQEIADGLAARAAAADTETPKEHPQP
jgi:hypothetical protein